MNSDALTISIADWSVVLNLDASHVAGRAQLREYYAAFLVSDAAPVFSIDVRIEPGEPYIPLTSKPFGSPWLAHTTERDGYITFESYFEKGWLDRRAGRGELVMRPQGLPENYLRVLYAWLCLEHHGLLLHASGVIANGKGYVFFGASGSGKTTVANLSLDRTVLSDDMVIVKRHGETVRLYGVPFRGEMVEGPRTNASADVRVMFSLVQAPEHALTPLTNAEAMARLAACVPFIMTRKEYTERVMQVCLDLARCVPVRALHFRRDAGFWEMIDALD